MAHLLTTECLASPCLVEPLLIPATGVAEVWNLAVPHLQKAFNLSPKVSPMATYEECLEGTAQLWVMWAQDELGADEKRGVVLGAALTEIIEYPSDWRTVRVIGCGGVQFERWARRLLTRIEAFAEEEDCTAVEIVGRKGWGRVFPEVQHLETTYVKEVGQNDKRTRVESKLPVLY